MGGGGGGEPLPLAANQLTPATWRQCAGGSPTACQPAPCVSTKSIPSSADSFQCVRLCCVVHGSFCTARRQLVLTCRTYQSLSPDQALLQRHPCEASQFSKKRQGTQQSVCGFQGTLCLPSKSCRVSSEGAQLQNVQASLGCRDRLRLTDSVHRECQGTRSNLSKRASGQTRSVHP